MSDVLKKLRTKAAEAWEAMGEIPNCPACGGTGEPTGKHAGWAIPVWWKGRKVMVCHHCEGRGKV